MSAKYLFMRIYLIMLLAITGYGCAAKKLVIENADYLLSRQIHNRIPLYSEQKKQLAKDMDQLLNQAKPDVENIYPVIDELDLTDSKKVSAPYKKIEDFYLKISRKFSDLISVYMAKLDKKQQKDFFQILEIENQKISKRKEEKSIAKIEDRMENILGPINNKQRQLIQNSAEYFEKRNTERVKRRVELHQTFRYIYSQDISEESRTRMFQEAYAAYQRKSLSDAQNLELLSELIPTLSNKQRKHFRKVAQEIKELLKYFVSIEY